MTGPSRSRLVGLLGAVSAGAAIGVFGIGSLVLVGWTCDIATLKSLHPGLISMKANTAAAFMLTGISLWLSQAKRTRFRVGRCVAWGSASVVAALGLLTLIEYLSGWSLGFDQLLFAEPSGAAETIYPGRMAPNTALNFLLIGLALLLLDVQTRRGHRPAQYLIGLEGIIAGVALVGYVYGASVLYSPSPAANPMSVPAVLAGVVAFVGLWLARPGPALLTLLEGEQAGSLMVRHLLLPVLLAPFLVDVVLLAGQRAGLYDEHLAAAAHVVLMIAILLGLVLAAAASLNRAEGELAALRHGQSGLPFPSIPEPGVRGRRKLRYLAAIVVVIAATVIRLGFLQSLGTRATFVMFYPAVVLAALYGGLPAGLLATVLSAGSADYFWIDPPGFGIQDPADWLALAIFLGSGTMISGVAEAMHRAQARAREAELQASLAAAGQREAELLRASEQRLHQANELVEAVTQGAKVLIAAVDKDYRYTFFNKEHHEELKRLTGKDTTLGMSLREVLADMPEERDKALALWARALKGETVVQTLRFGDPSRRRRWHTTRHTPIRGADGAVVGAGEITSDVTELIQAQEALRESEERYRTLFNTMIEGFCVIEVVFDEDGRPVDYRFLETNAAFEKQTGLHDAQGKLMRDLAPDHEAYWFEVYGKVALTGEPARFVNEARALNRWFDVSAVRLGGAESRKVAILFNDITESKLAEEALRESETRFRAIAANTPDHILMQDRDLRYQLVINPQLGLTEADMLGKTDPDFLEPEDAERITAIKRKVLETGEPVSLEAPLRSLKGETEYFAGAYVPKFDLAGKVDGLIGYFRNITEHKRAEKTLRESREYLSTVVRTSPAGIFVTREADGLFLEANEAYLKLIGYSAEEVIGHRSLELRIWVDPEERQKVVDALRRHGHIENSEIRFRCKTGEVVDLLYSARSFEQAGERCIVGALMDITERKKTSETLREREATLRGILKATKESVWLFSPEGVILMGNEMATARFGEDGERVIGKHFTEILPPALAQSRVAKLGEVVASGRPMESQDERAGMIFHHDWYPIVDGAGHVTSVARFSRDITERKRAEEALRQARDELEIRVQERTAELKRTTESLRQNALYVRSLIEASLDPLVTISPEGKITDVNQATEKVTGVPRAEMIGSDFSNYFTEPDRAREGYQKVISEGYVQDYPLTIHHTSGRATDVLYNATVYRNEGGQTQGVFAAARDITERKRAEAELARYRGHLEDLVLQRTDDLARSNRDLEQFAYVASHDLQEPLRAVAGFVGLLQQRYQGKLDEKADSYIHSAIDGATRMQTLIGDLLSYSRVGTKGKALEPTDGGKSLKDALTNLRASIEESGAVIQADPLPTVQADAVQLTQLYQNLIANAVKFRSDKPPEIHVGARREQDAWLFWVRDNGIGIDPQYAERIFMIFQRLHTRQKYPGTGIGLAICKRIVERHGGSIWVESQPGQGSTFYFTLPDKGEHL